MALDDTISPKVIGIYSEGDMNICTKFCGNLSNGQPHGGTRGQGITKVIRFHPLWTSNVCTNIMAIHLIVVQSGGPTYIAIPSATASMLAKNID